MHCKFGSFQNNTTELQITYKSHHPGIINIFIYIPLGLFCVNFFAQILEECTYVFTLSKHTSQAQTSIFLLTVFHVSEYIIFSGYLWIYQSPGIDSITTFEVGDITK